MLKLKEKAQFVKCPYHQEPIQCLNINQRASIDRRVLCPLCDTHGVVSLSLELAEQKLLDQHSQQKNMVYKHFQYKESEFSKYLHKMLTLFNDLQSLFNKQITYIHNQLEGLKRVFNDCKDKLKAQTKLDSIIGKYHNNFQPCLTSFQAISVYLSSPSEFNHQDLFNQSVLRRMDLIISNLKVFLGYPKEFRELYSFEHTKCPDLNWVIACAVSQDCKYLVCGTENTSKNIHCFEYVQEWRKRDVLDGHSSSIQTLEFSSREHVLLSKDKDKKIIFWKLNSHGKFNTVFSFEEKAHLIRLSPNNKFLVTGTENRLKIWGVGEGCKCFHSQTLERSDRKISQITISKCSLWLAVSADNHITVYEVANCKAKILDQLGEGSSNITAIQFGNDGLLASAGRDKQVRIWEYSKQSYKYECNHTLNEFRHPPACLAFSDDNTLVVSGNDNGIRLFYFNKKHCQWQCYQTLSSKQPTNQLCFFNQSKGLLARQLTLLYFYIVL